LFYYLDFTSCGSFPPHIGPLIPTSMKNTSPCEARSGKRIPDEHEVLKKTKMDANITLINNIASPKIL